MGEGQGTGMSATIHYRVLKPPEGYLKQVGSSSWSIESMRRAFGEYPWVLGAESLTKLEGMAATCDEKQNPFRELIKKIEKNDGSHVDVEVWPSY